MLIKIIFKIFYSSWDLKIFFFLWFGQAATEISVLHLVCILKDLLYALFAKQVIV